MKNRRFVSWLKKVRSKIKAWFYGTDAEETIVLVRYNPQTLKLKVEYLNLNEQGAYELLKWGAVPFLEYRLQDREKINEFLKQVHQN